MSNLTLSNEAGRLKMRAEFQKAKFYPRFAFQIRKLRLRRARAYPANMAAAATGRVFLDLGLSARSYF